MEDLVALPPVPPGVSGLVALFDYGGAEREVVLGLKHTRGVVSVPGLADALAGAVRATEWATFPRHVTWVPTTADRRRSRGYDQSRLLAKAVARRLHLPCRALLRRDGRAQQGLDAAARRSGPELTVSRRVPPEPVLLVDDVVTTGGTLSNAARALRAAGATDIFGAVLALTPPPKPGMRPPR